MSPLFLALSSAFAGPAPDARFCVADEPLAVTIRAEMAELWPDGPEIEVCGPGTSGWWTDGAALAYVDGNGVETRDEGPLDAVSVVLLARSFALEAPEPPSAPPPPLAVIEVTPVETRSWPDLTFGVGFRDRYDGFAALDSARLSVGVRVEPVDLELALTARRAAVLVATPHPDKRRVAPFARGGFELEATDKVGAALVGGFGLEGFAGPFGVRVEAFQRLALSGVLGLEPNVCADLLFRPRRISALATPSDAEAP